MEVVLQQSILVCGLGNPGERYRLTRHSVGFIIVDEIASYLGASGFRSGMDSFFSLTTLDSRKLILAKPQTFMNNSGRAVLKLMSFYKIGLSDVYVIHDDADLALGKVKVKCGGGAAGHNGIKSIDQAIGRDYHRIRVGIGRPEDTTNGISDYVLDKFDNIEDINKLALSISKHLNLLFSGNKELFIAQLAV